MTALLLALALSGPPTLGDAESQATALLRGCFVEKRLKLADQEGTIVTLWRCGGPASEPRSYLVGFIFQRTKEGGWARFPVALVEAAAHAGS